MTDPTSSLNESLEPLLSDFADDPEMNELVEYFVQQLPEHLDKIATAMSDGDLSLLETIAHQLKGSGAGYGYAPITASAADVEDAIRAGASDVSSLNDQVQALLQLCNRAMAGFNG